MLTQSSITLTKSDDRNLSLLLGSIAAAETIKNFGNKITISKNNLLKSDNFNEQPIEGKTYHIIHPVLKHIAILSCIND